MSDRVQQHNIGALLSVVTSVEPQSSIAATLNGGGIDRQAHNMPGSCVLHQAAGAISGGPATSSVISKLQDSADNAAFADYKPDGVNVATTVALTAANTENGVNVELTSARRYIRAVTTLFFTGGAAPAALVVSDIVLGGEKLLPAV